MALQVWLPLIGSLENKGLSGTKPENSGAVVDSSGKLGSCYSFGGSNFIDTKFVENFGTGDFTVSAWIYIIQTAGKTYQCIVGNKARAANSAGFSIYWNQNQKKFMWSTADGSATTEIWTSETFDSVVYNSWHHIAMVRNSSDPKKGYFYFDGIRKEIASVPAIRNVSTSTTVKIGSITPVDTAYYFTGKINDVRIYDHALSAREVQEIAKGLIVHYPFNDSVTNSKGKIYDCSGYCRHATTGSTALALDTTSPRYVRCLKNTSAYPLSASVELDQVDQITIASWVKLTAWGNQTSGLWATATSSLPVDYLKATCDHRDSTFDIQGTNGTHYRLACDTSDIPLNTWKYVVFRHDGVSASLFIDGNLKRSVACPTPLVGFKSIWLGYSRAGGVVRQCQGSWSDFRIYATALSADQIKELYNNPVSVCKSGNLMCMEVVEP